MPEENLLPEYFISRYVKQMKHGEIGYISPKAIICDTERRCYIELHAGVLPREDNIYSICVLRTEKGYNIALGSTNWSWFPISPHDIASYQWILVNKVSSTITE